MGRNELLSCVQGILVSAASWAEVQQKAACRRAAEKNGAYERGHAVGTSDVAQDVIRAIERAIAMIELLWEEEDRGPE